MPMLRLLVRNHIYIELISNTEKMCIEIRFKNYGLDLLEVSDNGDGISPDNFQSLGRSYRNTRLNLY